MTQGKIDYAVRQALNELDKWNDITGAIQKHSSWYYELQSVIEDAVHIGIQVSIDGEIKRDGFDNVLYDDNDK
jgi:hypothetical protein